MKNSGKLLIFECFAQDSQVAEQARNLYNNYTFNAGELPDFICIQPFRTVSLEPQNF
jgi:hypothetical protein